MLEETPLTSTQSFIIAIFSIVPLLVKMAFMALFFILYLASICFILCLIDKNNWSEIGIWAAQILKGIRES